MARRAAARAYAEERWEDAAEYARHAIDLVGTEDVRRTELLCLRGESLLRAGHARIAALAFAPVVEAGSGPYRPQALYSGRSRASGRGRGRGRRLASPPPRRVPPDALGRAAWEGARAARGTLRAAASSNALVLSTR